MGDPYQFLRVHRPDLLRHVVEVGLCVTCAPPRERDEDDADYRQRLGAAAEGRAAEIVAALLAEAVDG